MAARTRRGSGAPDTEHARGGVHFSNESQWETSHVPPGRIVTPRIERLRERALRGDPSLSFGILRDYHYLEGWMDGEGEALPLRNARAFARVIDAMPVRMAAGELLVGEHGGDSDLVNFRPVMSADTPARVNASRLLDEEQRARYLGWLERQPFLWQNLAPVAPWPDDIRIAHERGAIQIWGTDLNHSIRAYEKVLRLGFIGLRREIEESLSSLPLTDPDAPRRRANGIAWLRICDAASRLGARYAAEARTQASQSRSPDDREEWEEIARVCSHVPAHPARTFREALQALWFAHCVTVWEDGINANGIGRVDQFLWPYLERDLEERRLTIDGAAELLASLWIKLYRSYDVQQAMVGGQLPDGGDATNPLSYLILDVTEALGFVRCLSARFHRNSPPSLVSRCVDLVARGGGIPFFFNDEAIVPALVAKGIPIEEARGYAAIGCIEITIPGKANPHAVSHWINLPKCLELALNDGRDLRDNARIGASTGDLESFESMEDLFDAYTRQVEFMVDRAVYGSNHEEIAHKSRYRLPYLSLLTDDCVSRGLDLIEGGARFNYHSGAAMGIPNVADSLAALDLACYRERFVDRREMLDALRSDFEGQEALRIRLLKRLPKYGNDDPLPDGYAERVTRHICCLMGERRTAGGGTFFAHLFTFTLMLPMGRMTGATPDGRKAGEPLAYSVSPVQGRDTKGFTAAVSSLARIPHDRAAASSSAILEIDPSLLEGTGRDAFESLLFTAIDQGVGQLQINVVSADTLRAAKADPERYRSLCVRVSGFSQQFHLLDGDMQDHIIARTKHKV